MKAVKNFLGGLLLVIILIIIDREIGYEQEGKMEQPKHPMLWAWICLLALILLGWANKCLNAQEVVEGVTVPVKFDSIPAEYNALAITECDSLGTKQPTITVQTGVTGDLLILVLRHERVHAERMIKNPGGCIDWQRKYNTSYPFRFDEEAIAYCRGEYKSIKDSEIRKYWLDKISTVLFERFGQHFLTYSESKLKTAWKCGANVGVLYAPP